MTEESPHPAVPDYLVPEPTVTLDAETRASFDRLFDAAVANGGEIDYRLATPRWQFIAYIVETRRVLVHGSGNANIPVFEPRQPNDTTEFGNQRAVYAASAALWAMYFAILDRANYPMWLVNSAVQFNTPNGLSRHYYFFSISRPARMANAFTHGNIYFLPRRSFVQQPPIVHAGGQIHLAQWASLEPVVPLARIRIGPDDFPLLADIRGHDDEATFARARADPDGFPWLE